MKIEVLLAAYNNLEATQLTLEGYTRQSDRDFSICVADDGSLDDTRQLVESFDDRLHIRHLWHEDRGFRKSTILNRAIHTSTADYIVLSDNDCIPSQHFIADHKQAAVPGAFRVGRRVDLGPKATEEIFLRLTCSPDDRWWFLKHALMGNIKRAEKALRPPAWLHTLWSRKEIGALGANMGIWREALLRVNGFDEDFQGYGMEEVDLEWRLIASGEQRKSLLGRAVLYHLFHDQRPMTEENLERFSRKKQTGKWGAINGIAKLKEAAG